MSMTIFMRTLLFLLLQILNVSMSNVQVMKKFLRRLNTLNTIGRNEVYLLLLCIQKFKWTSSNEKLE